MKNLILKIKKHKILSLVILAIIIGVGYYGYAKYNSGNAIVSYITAPVARGIIVTSVSSSGQISASNQVDITPKVSGDIIKILVTSGQDVKSGEVIAQIDTTSAYRTVRDAQTNLQTAQLSLDKLKQAADADSVFSAQNTVASSQNSLAKLKLSQPIDFQNAQKDLQTAQSNLARAYSDAFTAISNSYLNLPNIITALNDILISDQISSSDISFGQGQINTDVLYNTTYETDKFKIKSYQTIAESDYLVARQAYDISYSDFKNASVYSDTATIEKLLAETLATAKAMAQAVKSGNNYLAAWSDSRALRNSTIFTQVMTYKINLSNYSGQVNTSFSNLSSAQSTIQNSKDAVTVADDGLKTLAQNQPLDLIAAENSLREKQFALSKLLAGADPLDIRSQELSVLQKRNALYDAQTALADYTIKALFEGVIAAVNVKAGDSAGSSAVISTIVTKQQIAELSLNELDAAKIRLGLKAIMTFDAIDGLETTGKIADIDTIGTVSQGVVTYSLKIIFDTQDDRVKPGMSTNATIITDSKADVLFVANSAIKNDGSNYVEVLNNPGKPQRKTVEVGLANDTITEIVGGLSEGEKVVTQTTSSGGISNSVKSGSAVNRNNGGFGGGLRIPGIGGGR